MRMTNIASLTSTGGRYDCDWKAYLLDSYNFAEFQAGAFVLDIGCGEGEQLQELERRGCLSVGIEPMWQLVTHCRVQGLRVLQAIGEQIPLKDESCDGLICKGVIPYTNEARALGEVGRLLKPGAIAHLLYLGAGYYLRYLLCALSWKYRVYGLKTLLNTWFYITTGRRLPSFFGDTIYQSHERLRKYYTEYGVRLIRETNTPTFLGFPVIIYHSIQKVTD